MTLSPPKKVKVVEIGKKGRGVIATEKIYKDEVIECCPLIILKDRDSQFISSKSNSDTLYYYYLQQPDLKRNAIMLGYGSLYNHSLEANAELDYPEDHLHKYIIFRATRDIEAGEEITWDYNFDNGIEFLPH